MILQFDSDRFGFAVTVNHFDIDHCRMTIFSYGYHFGGWMRHSRGEAWSGSLREGISYSVLFNGRRKYFRFQKPIISYS